MSLAAAKKKTSKEFDWFAPYVQVLECEIEQEQITEEVCTPPQLQDYLKEKLNLEIPTEAICTGHDAPFSFISDCFFEKIQNCIVIAPRNGGKTINAAALEFIEAQLKPGCESAHLGAIMAQAKRAYKYIRKWSYQYIEQIEKTIKEETKFLNGSIIEIIPGTITGVNSPHPNKATIDEFELLPWEIFEEAGSMSKSSNKIKAALRLLTTRKSSHGNAQTMISEAEVRGFRLYKWCIFEVMTKCEHAKSCSSCPYAKHTSFKSDGTKITWPEVCRGTKEDGSFRLTQGKAKKSNGYFLLEDVLQKFLLLSWEVFDAQWLCNRPERYDAVFHEFDFDRNTITNWTPRQTGGWTFARGWDFGLDNPTAILYMNIHKKQRKIVVFDEDIVSGKLIDEIGVVVRKKSDKLASPEDWEDWGDPSGNAITGVDGNSYIGKLSRHEIRILSQFAGVSEGIQNVKDIIRVSNLSGKSGFSVVRGKARRTIQALECARWDRIETKTKKQSREKYCHDEHSHPLDALRYLVSGVFPLVPSTLGFG